MGSSLERVPVPDVQRFDTIKDFVGEPKKGLFTKPEIAPHLSRNIQEFLTLWLTYIVYFHFSVIAADLNEWMRFTTNVPQLSVAFCV